MSDNTWKLVFNPFGDGYTDGFDRDRQYQFSRDKKTVQGMYRLSDQSPAFNVAGLYYRDIADVFNPTPPKAA